MKFLNKFRRITSLGNYIPEIDGLRFIAISMVIIFHMQGYFLQKSGIVFTGNTTLNNTIIHILSSWDKGVLLFFVISGLILALPFAGHSLKGSKKPALKNFYLRRLTRLEPPYFVAVICLFFVLLLMKAYSFQVLFPSLLASLTYTHNIIFGTPLIAVVTWSLEVEIQFYIIAPFITCLYKLNKQARRVIMISAILLLPVIQHIFTPSIITLYDHLQYFLLGLLLADYYVCRDELIFIRNNRIAVITGIICFATILCIDQKQNLFSSWLFLSAIFIFYYLVLFNSLWKKVFSVPLIAVIGGMCYSIYLWHYPIISLTGRFMIHYNITSNYLISFTVFCSVISIPVLVFSSIYFYSIEKPCMSKNWYKGITLKKKTYKQEANV